MSEPRVLTLPTILTLARLAAAPLAAAAILHRQPEIALALFGMAAATDWLDGYLARKLGQTSTLGAALDHAADKALVTGVLVALAGTGLPLDLVAAAALILMRDVAVAGLREGLSLSGRALPVASLGKVKTVFEFLGVGGLIAARLPVPETVATVAQVCLWAATGLALWSGAIYLRSALKA